MKVSDIMSRDVVSTRPEATVQEAVALMLDRGFRHMPVVDGAGRLAGILSDRDIRTALGDPQEVLTSERDGIENMIVREVMTEAPALISADITVQELARRLVDDLRGRVSALPVIDGEDRLVGMVSYVDVLRAVGEGRDLK